MNRLEFNIFQKMEQTTKVKAEDYPPGTLVFGYTCTRASFHVYRGTDGLIHRFVYRATDRSMDVLSFDSAPAWDADRLIPDKRAYPECTPLDLASLLRVYGVDVPYTTFDDTRYDRFKDAVYHGRVKDGTT